MNPLGGTELQHNFLINNVKKELLEGVQICLSVPEKTPLGKLSSTISSKWRITLSVRNNCSRSDTLELYITLRITKHVRVVLHKYQELLFIHSA